MNKQNQIKFLSSPDIIKIMSHISIHPQSIMELKKKINMPNTTIYRKIEQLEELKCVKSHTEKKDGKNLKKYSLGKPYQIRLSPGKSEIIWK